MFLYYVKAGDEINNADLNVIAANAKQAASLWAEYYAHTDHTEIDHIWRVNRVNPGERPRALKWHEDVVVEDHE